MRAILRSFIFIMVLCAVFLPGTSTKCNCSCDDLCSSYNTRATCVQYGCAHGYCWASCEAVFIQGEWCWTTKGALWDRNYVKCDYDFECNPNWHCAGACALFDTFNATSPEMDNTKNIDTNNV
ncbi:hypothetical protein HA402_005614 [Bradysia odoriphaga]|nr:hypothetical protein HA402_005614 [Bradysia odoriphaga]